MHAFPVCIATHCTVVIVLTHGILQDYVDSVLDRCYHFHMYAGCVKITLIHQYSMINQSKLYNVHFIFT